jgi:hypothetical protein
MFPYVRVLFRTADLDAFFHFQAGSRCEPLYEPGYWATVTKYLVLELFSSSQFTRQLIPHQYLLDKVGAGAVLRSVQETKLAVLNILVDAIVRAQVFPQLIPDDCTSVKIHGDHYCATGRTVR